jgi:ubiquinone/menaquinone biosynthesis C-methylase UbiE
MEIHEGHKERYNFFKQRVHGKVLDAGCGPGLGTNILAERADEVVGIDLNEPSLEYAIAHKLPNALFKKMDVTKMEFPDNTFDCGVSSEVIEHMDEASQYKYLEELQRVVKPGGPIFISTPDKYVWHQKMALSWDEHIRELTKQELRDIAGRYFDVVGFYGQWKTVHVPRRKRIVRGILNILKKADVFQWRYAIAKDMRVKIDKGTSLVNQDHWRIEKLEDGETAAQQLVVCTNRK